MVTAVVAVFGLLFGSFTTVLASRVPEGRGVVSGRSACPRCGEQIRWHDNIPVLSWLVLHGRCRSCGAPISWTYPVIELAVALLWVLVHLRYGLSWTSAVLWILAVASVALFVIDVRHHRLPHRIVLPAYGLVSVPIVIAWLTGERSSWGTAALGLAVMGGFYGLLWFLYPKGMGFGDVTTAGLLGLVLGFLGLEHLAVGAIAGPLAGGLMVVVLAAMGRARKGTAVPYGPALLLGAWIGILVGPAIAQGYIDLLIG